MTSVQTLLTDWCELAGRWWYREDTGGRMTRTYLLVFGCHEKPPGKEHWEWTFPLATFLGYMQEQRDHASYERMGTDKSPSRAIHRGHPPRRFAAIHSPPVIHRQRPWWAGRYP